jgi:hypothetical protein
MLEIAWPGTVETDASAAAVVVVVAVIWNFNEDSNQKMNQTFVRCLRKKTYPDLILHH